MPSHVPAVPAALRFDRAPQRIYWEITRACSLACRHCRAEASPEPEPGELTPAEGRALLDRLAQFGDPPPKVILTGGDPLERADLWELIAHARSLGLGVSVSPSATPRLTPEVIFRMANAGVEAISLSIDASTAARHDALRGVPGCFERTLLAARAAANARLPVQVNTLVCAETVDDLPAVHALTKELHVARWSLFFLVSVGRGTVLQQIEPETVNRLLEWVAEQPRDQLPLVTTTEAPHFRRIQLQRRRLPQVPSARAGFGIRDGNGVMFISNTGDVSPSGFLPLTGGNVRTQDPVAIYRGSDLFTSLREPTTFGGRCGACEFHAICGGSRARAWTATGGSPRGGSAVRLPALTLLIALLVAGCGAHVDAAPPVVRPPTAPGIDVDSTVTTPQLAPEPAPNPEPAPTWAAIYDRYFSVSSEASCGRSRKCHADQMGDADTAYTWLAQRGYISGRASPIASTRNSCLRWFGGNMPPGGKPNPRAVEDLSAWVASGAPNN